MRPGPLLAFLAALPLLPGAGAMAQESEPPQPTQVIYEGAVDLEGHYARPGDTRAFRSRERYRTDGRGNVLLEWTTWPEGDSAGAPEAFLVVGSRTFHRDEPSAPWRELRGMRADQARFHALAGIPQGHPGCHALTPVKAAGKGPRGPGAKDRSAEVTARRAHPRLGDVTDRVRYDLEWGNPGPMRMEIHERDQRWTLEATPISVQCVTESLLAVPASFEPAPEHPDSLRGEPVLREVGTGVWAADMDDLDTRSLVVEFADHLAVIEAAVSSANGERLVDAVKRRWPEKPVRYALFSHHHPHYLGGLRALIAEGATVITTPGNDSLVHAIATYSFELRSDRLARATRARRDGAGARVRTLPFPGRIELADSTNRLVAINIGERSQHTAEFAIFWLPRQRLLFQAEQGWFTTIGELRAGRRAAKLLEILSEESLDVERIVQSWPMRGTEPEMSAARLAELVSRRGSSR